MQDNQFKFSCITVNSIRLMAEIANLPEPSTEVATTLGEDATFRLKQVITRAHRIMTHSKRTRLTCSDINKALKWSDSQPVFGHECNPNRPLAYSYSMDAQVFVYENEFIDLEQQNESRLNISNLLSEEQLSEAVPEMTVEQCDKIHL